MPAIDPFTLLIIIFFVVWPLLNALFRRPQGRPPPPRPRPAERQPPAQQRVPRQPEAGTDFERRLEEARRRVQEAMGQESAPRGEGREARQSRTTPQRRPTPERPRPQGPPPPRTEPLREREPGSIYGGELGSGGREIGGRDERPTSAYAARVQRPSQIPLGLDRTSLPQAIIWREILDKPPSRRRRPL